MNGLITRQRWTLLWSFFLVMQCTHAHAYIDPGTGSLVLQVVVGAVLGGLFFLKMFFRKIVTFFRKLFAKKDASEEGSV